MSGTVVMLLFLSIGALRVNRRQVPETNVHSHARQIRKRFSVLCEKTQFKGSVAGLRRSVLSVETPARIAHAEAFFAATGADLSHGGSRAFCRPSTDSIVLPMFEAFRDAESYYSTLAHETTHWTSHASRLAREFGSKRFGSEAYAVEELVAELGAAFLCADLDLALEPREDHASYIANWLKVLKDDNRAIFTAASHPQRAVDFLHGLQVSAPSSVAATP